MTDSIFIQMAAYRDPELIPTLTDALNHASDPTRLHFCIAWQHGADEAGTDPFAELRARTRLTVLAIPAQESKGACWARHMIQQHYDGERYTMQLDSHHRFVPGWDALCVTMFEDLRKSGVPKPLLTAYLPSYDPENDPDARAQEPWSLEFDRFIPEGAIFTRPVEMRNWSERTLPARGRFYSAHFAFTDGAFSTDVQHDPEFYFHGEEISITARAFTHGYDIFYPHRIVGWHEYSRKGRTKHWDEHADWGHLNDATHTKNRRLFGMDEFLEQPDVVTATQCGPYGFGTARTLEDYERYAGLSFQRRAVSPALLAGVEPSLDDNRELPYAEFTGSLRTIFKHCLDVGLDKVPLDDYDFWTVAFQNADGEEMFRQDADEDEIVRMRSDPDRYCKVWREFDTEHRPRSWTIWPHSRAQGWCPPIIGSIL
jgi:hypothetical protein